MGDSGGISSFSLLVENNMLDLFGALPLPGEKFSVKYAGKVTKQATVFFRAEMIIFKIWRFDLL